MPTLSLTVLPAKALKGGKNKVRIAVAHNSQTRYIVTDVVIDSPREWKNGQIVKRDDAAYLNTRLRKKLNEVQHSIDEVPYPEGLTCAELIDAATRAHTCVSHTLATAFEEMMSVSTAKQSSIDMYRSNFRSISRHLNTGTPVTQFSQLMVRKYIKQRSKLAHATLQEHVTLLSRIMKYCQQNGYADFRTNPVTGCLKYSPSVRQSWLTPDQVRTVRDFPYHFKRSRKFRDLFMLSYYLGGMNIIDMVKLDFRGQNVRYKRTKTERALKVNPFVEFEIPGEARVIIEKYIQPNGTLKIFGKVGYKSTFMSSMGNVAREEVGLPQMTFYSARKSFAQHAFQLGVSESVIDYILGHSLNSGRSSTIYAYIKVTPAMATDAVRKVVDFINGNNNFD
jgi:integrase